MKVRGLVLWVLTLSMAGVVSGCSFLSSAQADKVLAGTVLATPAYDPGPALAATAGITLPAGIPTIVPAQSVVQIFFGKRTGSSLGATKADGITGASVTLTYGSNTCTLTDLGAGNYGFVPLAASTCAPAPFSYVAGVSYDLTVLYQGESFTASCVAPAPESTAQLHVPSVPVLPVSGSEETQLTRASTDTVAFTSIFPLGLSGMGDPTYTDMPTALIDLVDLVANDARWRQKVITVPGSAFPAAGGLYLVNVSAVERGSTSDNLFTASVFLVGTADLGLAHRP